MLRLYNQGMVLGEDGEKMSKSRGNVVAPDALVAQYGADTVRTYLVFFSKWDQGGPWNYDGIKGPQRLLNDIWDIATTEYSSQKVDETANRNLRRKTHQVIRKVTDDFETFSFNTAVAAIMELRNNLIEARRSQNVTQAAWDEAVDKLLLLLAPFAPHITEELWERRGHAFSIHQQSWPVWDAEIAKDETITLVVQINGKVRDKIDTTAGQDDETLKTIALNSEKVQTWLEGNESRKIIVVKGKLINIVK